MCGQARVIVSDVEGALSGRWEGTASAVPQNAATISRL
jgi:hypothetical protein